MRIITGIYDGNATFAGWLEDEAKTWIVFIRHDGGHDYFGDRDPSTGACIG